MRSRYSAHVLGLVDYVVATYHPSCHAEDYRDAIADSVNSQWLGLNVISSEITSSGEGFVEFEAYYQDESEQFCLAERSRFLQETIDGTAQWYYIDGEYPAQTAKPELPSSTISQPTINTDKVGRNDPCVCGSGKKYKKCCG